MYRRILSANFGFFRALSDALTRKKSQLNYKNGEKFIGCNIFRYFFLKPLITIDRKFFKQKIERK